MFPMHRFRRTLLAGTLWLAVAVPAPAQPGAGEAALPVPGIGPAGEVKRVADGFRFTEGPAGDAEGNLYFTDVPESLVLRLDAAGRVTTLLTDSNRMNGLMLDRQGRLVACQGGAGKLIALDANAGDHPTTLAADHAGVRFNAPNDLVVDAEGGIYFTDPLFGRGELPQKSEGVFYVSPAGKVTLVLKDRAKPNGISLSPDEKTLYVLHSSNSGLAAFPLEAPGRVGKGKRLGQTGRGDGMTVDEKGNLYLTQPGAKAIVIMAPDGRRLGRILFPESPSNCTFGGRERRTLFVTARTSVYAVPMHVRGTACR